MQKKKQSWRRSPRPLGWWAVKHLDCCAGFTLEVVTNGSNAALLAGQMPRLVGFIREKNQCSGCLSNEFTAEILELKRQRQQDHCKFQASIVSFRPTRLCFKKIFLRKYSREKTIHMKNVSKSLRSVDSSWLIRGPSLTILYFCLCLTFSMINCFLKSHC